MKGVPVASKFSISYCQTYLLQWGRVGRLPDDSFPPLSVELLTLSQVQEKEVSSLVDFIAVVFEIGTVNSITCNDGRRRTKRNVTLVDNTLKMVTLTLWPDFTELLNGREGTAVLFQNVQVR